MKETCAAGRWLLSAAALMLAASLIVTNLVGCNLIFPYSQEQRDARASDVRGPDGRAPDGRAPDAPPRPDALPPRDAGLNTEGLANDASRADGTPDLLKPDGTPTSEWTTVVAPGVTANLLGVSGIYVGFPGAEVVIVGSGCTVLKIDWSGLPTTVPPPPGCTTETLNAVWSAGRNDFFVAGEGGNLYHRGPNGWDAPKATGTSALLAIGGSFPASGTPIVLAVGDGDSGWLYDTGSWKSHVMPSSGPFLGVRSFSGPTPPFSEWIVVGTDGKAGVVYENHTVDAASVSWGAVPVAGSSAVTYGAVWGPLDEQNPVVAVGDKGTVIVRQADAWKDAQVQSWVSPTPTLTGVWGTVSSNQIQLFVVGYGSSTVAGVGRAFRLTGFLSTLPGDPLALNAHELSLPSGTGPLHAVWGYSDGSQTTVYAVGDNGTILKHTSP